tara:strand:- start:2856 stop:3155 length:300 start_codon:yes stop_codon:yes gene_type:complete
MKIKVNDRVELTSTRLNCGNPKYYKNSNQEIHGQYPDYDDNIATVIEIFNNNLLLRIEGDPEESYIRNPLYIPNTLVLWYNKSSINRVLTNKVTYEESL